MDESPDAPRPSPAPAAPDLPHVDSPPIEKVIDSLPSKEDVVGEARSADEIVREQPSVDDILGPDRK